MRDSSREALDRPASPENAPGLPQKSASSEAMSSRFRVILEGIGLIIAPVTLITALLYYFGWVRTSAYYLQFGIDHSVLDFGSTDYLMRSVEAMFLPIAIVAVIGMAALEGHRAVLRLIRGAHGPQIVSSGLAILTTVGVVLIMIGVLGLSPTPLLPAPIVEPVCLALGSALLIYRTSLAKALANHSGQMTLSTTLLPSVFLVFGSLAIATGLFWAVADYANVVGKARAEEVIRQLPKRPDIVLYSERRLGILGAGIREERGDANSAYQYRYSGLKLLLKS